MPAEKNKMTLWQLIMLTSVNMMGAGIAMLPARLAEVGTISICSWLITILGSLCLAFALAKCGRFSQRPGLDGFAACAFGKAGSFMVCYTYGLSLLFANVAIAVILAGYLVSFFNIPFNPLVICFLTIAALWICPLPCHFGAATIGNFASGAMYCALTPMLLLMATGWIWFSPETYAAAWNPHDEPFFTAIDSSISLTLWAFIGLESACVNSGAVENPQKNGPIAVVTATCGVAIIYFVTANIAAGICPNEALLLSDAPFGLVFQTMFHSEIMGSFVNLLLAISCVGSLLGWQFTFARVCRSAASQGFLPSFFGKINRWDAPEPGLVILTLIQSGFCLLTLSPDMLAAFNEMVDVAAVLNIFPYILCMASVASILSVAKVRGEKARVFIFVSLLGSAYSFYALICAGLANVFWGAVIAFAGWTIFGLIVRKWIASEPA